MADKSLTTLDFHGATLIARRGDTPAETLVAMKPVVEGMGLDWSGQHKKLLSHPVLAQGISVMTIPFAGGHQEMTALPLNRLNFWLATIQPDRVPDEAVRAKVIAYQTECADALFDHFFGHSADVLTPERCQDLRAMIGLSRTALAHLAGFPANTITLFENDRMVLSPESQLTLRHALESAAARLRRVEKAAGRRPVKEPALPPSALVKLEFSVPADLAAKVCAHVAKLTEAHKSKAVSAKGE